MREREVKHTKKYEKKKERGRKMNSKTMSKKMNISFLIFYCFFKKHSVCSEKMVQMRHPTKLNRP